jgi:hypothetical protein
MLLEIDDWRSVSDLQYRFNKCFPDLHLHIYPPQVHGVKNAQVPLGGNLLLLDARKIHTPGILELKSWFTKEEVETMLKEKFGIYAEILLAPGGTILPGKPEKNLSLHQLNDHAQKAILQPVSAAVTELEYPEEWL